MLNSIRIITDYREIPSNIPALLESMGVEVEFKNLKAGDYLVNRELIVERKTAEDFVLSLIQGRLFSQCVRMKKRQKPLLFLIEGNPYDTDHKIDKRAIKGALVSVTLAWQIPLIFAEDKEDTARILLMGAQQQMKEQSHSYRTGRSPKNPNKKALYFLQGLPDVGPVLAKALLDQFGSLENVVLAEESELREVEGLGKVKAERIRKFLGFSSKSGKAS